MIFMTAQRAFYILSLIFLAIVSADQNHECKRRCVTGAPHLKCRYDFVVTQIFTANTICENGEESDCNDQSNINSAILINNKTPGPTIEVCLGDIVEVFLHNKLSSQEISLHWHGVRQLGAPHMDGVTMISQCPILPFSSFRYDIKPEYNGTFFYHAHSIGQQGDGLYGALIVRNPDDDSSLEKLLIVSAQSSTALSGFPNLQSPLPIAITLNGKIDNMGFDVENGKEYRLRLINANVFNCPIAFSIDGHTLEVKAVGDKLVERTRAANYVIIFPGERMDILLRTNSLAKKYRIILQGSQDCKNLIHEATLSYDGTESEVVTRNNSLAHFDIPEELHGYHCDDLGRNVLCAMDLRNWNKFNRIENPSATYYIPFDVNYYGQFTDDMTDYAFKIYGFTYYPSYLSTSNSGASIAQVNRMTFKYPPSPILSQPDAVPDDMICSLDDRSKSCDNNPYFCECLQILSVTPRTEVEIILIDEGRGGNVSQVMHVHGYSVSVVGFRHFTRPITKEEIIALDHEGLLPRNLENPPEMDTFVIPNKGYIILRLFTDNLGYWLWEARNTGVFSSHSAPAMQFLMRIGNTENLPIVPIDFPTCGNHKGPDLIFEDE